MAVLGTVYLLHFDPPYRHARHYIGWALSPARRFEEHRSGNGSPLVKAAVQAGCEVRLVRTWDAVDRHFERRLKNQKNSSRFCPLCKES